MTPAANDNEVLFAGKFLALHEDRKHLLMIDVSPSAVSTYGFLLEGAFVTALSSGGWLFVEGPRSFGTQLRKALFDDGGQATSNAEAMVALGVRLLSEAEAQRDVDDIGHFINNITAEERARALALAASGLSDRT